MIHGCRGVTCRRLYAGNERSKTDLPNNCHVHVEYVNGVNPLRPSHELVANYTCRDAAVAVDRSKIWLPVQVVVNGNGNVSEIEKTVSTRGGNVIV